MKVLQGSYKVPYVGDLEILCDTKKIHSSETLQDPVLDGISVNQVCNYYLGK